MNNWRKEIVKWRVGDTLYLSVTFSWQRSEAELIASQHKGKVVIGGIGSGNNEACPDYDVLSMHNPLATFTTRGCIRKCPFCIVPKAEGDFRELSGWKPAPMVCDNNILAASQKHFERVIDSLTAFPYVDFNQGLDARLLNDWHIEQLQRLRGVKIRFAFDHTNQEREVTDAIGKMKRAGFRDFGVYVLIGFKDAPEDAHYRLEYIRSLGIWPNPMRYQPLNTQYKDSYVAPDWTEKELKRTMRYYSRLRWLEHIPFKDYQPQEQLEVF